MLPSFAFGDKIFRWLIEIDEETCRRVAAARCPHCEGPLHRGDYPRKPRGGLLAATAEAFTRRLSLCCGWSGCRRRATPPSVRFLGRRVYAGVAVVLASIVWRAVARASEAKRVTGIPARTQGRWVAWWEMKFPQSKLYQQERGRFLPPLVISELPASLVERFEAAAAVQDGAALVRALVFLSPLTTQSVVDGSRFVRAR